MCRGGVDGLSTVHDHRGWSVRDPFAAVALDPDEVGGVESRRRLVDRPASVRIIRLQQPGIGAGRRHPTRAPFAAYSASWSLKQATSP